MTKKKQVRFTKWRISDVVAAGRRARRIVGSDYDASWARSAFTVLPMEAALRSLDITVPIAIGFVDSGGTARVDDWHKLTHEQRCDLIVAEARRLNVPKRAR